MSPNKKEIKNKKVYLSNGEEVELLAQYQDRNKTEYVVRVVIGENTYEEGESELIYENRIVLSIYENYKDVPMFLRKTELESKVEELHKNIKELTEQKMKFTKELKSVYTPQYSIGLPIYYTIYGNEVEELKIVRIVFTEQEDRSFYTYYCNAEYKSFEEIGDYYHLTKEDAEKSRQQYLENKKIENRKRIEENFKKAKEEFENLTPTNK